MNFKKYGIERDEKNDFRDDGTAFKFYNYKGLPISYARANGQYYLDIRLDYLNISFKEYKEDIELIEEFNGTYEIDIEKFIKNCNCIISKYLKKVIA